MWSPTEKTIDWVLPYQQYQDQLVDQAALMLTLSGRVSQTQQVLATQFSFRLRTPELLIKVTTHSNQLHWENLLTAHTCMHQQTYACTHTHTQTRTRANT